MMSCRFPRGIQGAASVAVQRRRSPSGHTEAARRAPARAAQEWVQRGRRKIGGRDPFLKKKRGGKAIAQPLPEENIWGVAVVREPLSTSQQEEPLDGRPYSCVPSHTSQGRCACQTLCLQPHSSGACPDRCPGPLGP